MNILVTGANGQLGNEIRIVAAAVAAGQVSANGYRFDFTDISEPSDESLATLHRLAEEGVDTSSLRLDITDETAVRAFVAEHKIGVVVNCAAYTNVDAAESDEPLARKLNAVSPAILARVMGEAGGLLVHVSTDYVFGAEPYNTPCSEDRTGTPTGVYGRTKLEGERNILASGCNAVIVRTAWLYSEFGRNFCRTMMNLTSTKPQIKVVFDQVGTPTYALDLARAIMRVVEDYSIWQSSESGIYPRRGIYHYSNEGVCSWFDFAKSVQEIHNALRHAAGCETTRCEVLPCHSSEFPSPVRRPAYSVLDKTKMKSTFGLDIPYWTASLRKCITNLTGK